MDKWIKDEFQFFREFVGDNNPMTCTLLVTFNVCVLSAYKSYASSSIVRGASVC